MYNATCGQGRLLRLAITAGLANPEYHSGANWLLPQELCSTKFTSDVSKDNPHALGKHHAHTFYTAAIVNKGTTNVGGSRLGDRLIPFDGLACIVSSTKF